MVFPLSPKLPRLLAVAIAGDWRRPCGNGRKQ